jgi:DNA-binding NtrC family response regulator
MQEAIDITRPYHEQKQQILALFNRTFVERLLDATAGNQAEAARRCGLERRYFGRLMAKYGVKP